MPINIDIPQAQLENAIAFAISESFGPERKDALLRDIIRAHLHYRENSYDKETLLGKRIGVLVRDIVQKEIERIITEDLAPDIRKIVSQNLGDKFKDSVLEQLKSAVSRMVVSGINITPQIDYDTE
jgi:hypothetical protein